MSAFGGKPDIEQTSPNVPVWPTASSPASWSCGATAAPRVCAKRKDTHDGRFLRKTGVNERAA